MQGTATVVTPERYAQGLTYQEFLAQAKVNLDKFAQYYESVQVNAPDTNALRRLMGLPHGPMKMLALGEDWCPDVFRGLPVFQRIAEATGMELRVFPRDKNIDIMNEFLKEGKFQSIITVVFYTKDLHYIAHWIERPQIAYTELATFREEAAKTLPAGSEQRAIFAEAGKRYTPRFPHYQQESIKEVIQLLTSKVK